MRMLLSFILCCIMLTGCNGTPTETTLPTSSQEVSVTESKIIETDPPTSPSTEETSQAVTESPATNTWPFDAEPTPESKPAETIQFIVYSPNCNADGFYVNAVERTIVEGSEYSLTLLEAMIEMCVLTKDVEINSIIQEETHLTIDFNHAFKDLVCTMGTSGERLLVGSVVNTMIANYNVETISITIDGEIWESGHMIYDFPMGFFE